MDDWIWGLLGLVIGVGLGAAALAVPFLIRRGRLVARLATAEMRADDAAERVDDLAATIDRLRGERDALDREREGAEGRAIALAEKLHARETQLADERRLLDGARGQLSDAFTALGTKALRDNNEQFLQLAEKRFESLLAQARGDVEQRKVAIDGLIKPIRELLEKQRTAVTDLERKREVAYRGLEEQIRQIATSHERLDRQTGRLVTALRRPEHRGRWGEMQLRNVVELAGLREHCDFTVQAATDDPATRDRPDMTVNLPGGGLIVVDAKVALDAYLDALEPDHDRVKQLRRHTEQVERHVRRLSEKRYWEQFERTPDLVVMFMPLESALVAALEVDHELHARAMRRHVLIATPTLLVALLQSIAYGWRQEAVAENAREIARVGRELFDRVSVFTSHFEQVGRRLGKATEAYNQAVGSLETRILPSTRRLRELGATSKKTPPSPARIEAAPRPVTAIELKLPPEGTDAHGDEVTEGGAPSNTLRPSVP